MVWRTLTGKEQRALIDNYPEFIGNGGFPTGARYEANEELFELCRNYRDVLLGLGMELNGEQRRFVADTDDVEKSLRPLPQPPPKPGWPRRGHGPSTATDPPFSAVEIPSRRRRSCCWPTGERSTSCPMSMPSHPKCSGSCSQKTTRPPGCSGPPWPPARAGYGRSAECGRSSSKAGREPALPRPCGLTAARRARAPEGSNPTAPRLLWASDPSRPAGRRAGVVKRRRALAEKRKSMLRTLDGGMLVYGHRGAPLDEAENNWKGYVLGGGSWRTRHRRRRGGARQGPLRQLASGQLPRRHKGPRHRPDRQAR